MTALSSITAAINAKFTTPPVITLAQAKTATTDYVNVFISRRYTDNYRGSGEVSVIGYRAVIRCVCKTEANLGVFVTRVTAALEDQILSGDVGPFRFETESTVDPDAVFDGDWYIADLSWAF